MAVQWPEKKQVKVMTSLVWIAFLVISNGCTSKQMTFLESWDKTGQDSHALKEEDGVLDNDSKLRQHVLRNGLKR